MPVTLKKIVAAQPKMKTVVEEPGKQPVEEEKEVGSPQLLSEPLGTVGVSFGRKFSDGNYGSYNLGVWVSVPCENTEKGRKQAYSTAYKFAEDKMVAMLKGTPAEMKTTKEG